MRPHMHARRVEIAEPRAPLLGLALHEVDRTGQELLVDRLHALGVQGTCVLDDLLAHAPEGFIDRIVVLVNCPAFQHPARTEFFATVGILWIVRILRLLLGVQMVQVAEEFVETVHRRQVFVTVAKVVLAELPGRVAEMLEELRDARILETEPKLCARKADLGETGSDRRLSGDEGGAPCGAALLAIEVGKHRAFSSDAGEVWRTIAHDALGIGTELKPTYVVRHDEENIRLTFGHFPSPVVQTRLNGASSELPDAGMHGTSAEAPNINVFDLSVSVRFELQSLSASQSPDVAPLLGQKKLNLGAGARE